MTGIIIFFIILALVLFIMRYAASKLYDKNHPEELIQSNSELMTNQNSEENNLVDDQELIAVISAAAFTILNKKVKVKKINFLSDSDHSAWSRAGRLNVMSHSITHR